MDAEESCPDTCVDLPHRLQWWMMQWMLKNLALAPVQTYHTGFSGG